MRLWHQSLLPFLPRAQLLGQHRECAALRGLAWGRKHATVDYVFTHSPARLVAYHGLVMGEMQRRGYRVDQRWLDPLYRGLRSAPFSAREQAQWEHWTNVQTIIYPEHDHAYLVACLDNLKQKGIELPVSVGQLGTGQE